MAEQQTPVASDSKAEAHKGGVSIEAAMRVVPNFDGSSSDQADLFLRACDFGVRIVDPEQIDILVQGLIIKLSGRALQSIRYKEITTYKEFRKKYCGNIRNKKAVTSATNEITHMQEES